MTKACGHKSGHTMGYSGPVHGVWGGKGSWGGCWGWESGFGWCGLRVMDGE